MLQLQNKVELLCIERQGKQEILIFRHVGSIISNINIVLLMTEKPTDTEKMYGLRRKL